jgi:hypothetical protein
MCPGALRVRSLSIAVRLPCSWIVSSLPVGAEHDSVDKATKGFSGGGTALFVLQAPRKFVIFSL